MKKSSANAIYIHVPFCKNICHYCDFCKIVYNSDLVDKYLNTLQTEIDKIEGKYRSIYIGGGSPSSLNNFQLEFLLSKLSNLLDTTYEFCIELNPDDMDYSKVQILKKYGINRVSIGIQTFNQELLKTLNRKHSNEEVFELIDKLRSIGIDNISGDLMYGLPNQSMDDIKNDLDIMVNKLHLKHISTYALLVEDNTYFGVKHIESLDDDTEADQYQYICDYLESNNYEHYEVSNFALKGYESKHNLVYWQAEEYIGLGSGASGYENSIRYDNSKSITDYCKGLINKEETKLDDNDKEYEYIILSLRLSKGINLKEFEDRFHANFLEKYRKTLDKLVNNNLIEIDKDRVCVKKDKFFILNTILCEF